MKKKERLLALLIAFPVIFFGTILYMSSKVTYGSSVVDIRTVETAGPPEPHRAGEGADIVERFLRDGGKVVVVIMHPTSRYLDIQVGLSRVAVVCPCVLTASLFSSIAPVPAAHAEALR